MVKTNFLINKMVNFICFSVDNWSKRKARKQQFMLHLSKRDDVGKVLYIEPPLNFFRLLMFYFTGAKTLENRKRWIRAITFNIYPLKGKLFLYTPLFFIPFSFRIQFIYNFNLFILLLILKIKIKKLVFTNTVLWFYHPFDYPILKWFKNRALSVFDWAEEWAEYFVEFSKRKRKKIKLFEERIIKEADLVFVVSQKLLEEAKKFNNNSYRLFDGTEYRVFQNTSDYIPRDIKHIKKPILGYLGTISHRIDVELLKFISKELPSISLVLIGDIHYKRVNISSLKDYKNIFFLGGKNYGELGKYTKYFDVCILPYKPALVSSPATKVYDYFATGKPIVMTNLLEMEKFRDFVKIARTKKEFVNYIEESLKEENPGLVKMRIKIAKENSWEARTDDIIDEIKKSLVEKNFVENNSKNL
jgi:hypothetical protein